MSHCHWVDDSTSPRPAGDVHQVDEVPAWSSPWYCPRMIHGVRLSSRLDPNSETKGAVPSAAARARIAFIGAE